MLSGQHSQSSTSIFLLISCDFRQRLALSGRVNLSQAARLGRQEKWPTLRVDASQRRGPFGQRTQNSRTIYPTQSTLKPRQI
jgi:hypothetical protein